MAVILYGKIHVSVGIEIDRTLVVETGTETDALRPRPRTLGTPLDFDQSFIRTTFVHVIPTPTAVGLPMHPVLKCSAIRFRAHKSEKRLSRCLAG